MKVGSSIIAFLGLMAVCSCSAPKSEMSTLVNGGQVVFSLGYYGICMR